MGVTGGTGDTVKTDIPNRLDRLPWSRWHWTVVIALGITWILDGLEVTLVGSVAAALTNKGTLHFTTSQATAAGSFYLAGAVAGALFFGYLTDRFGRKKLFMITLGIYLVFTVATALSWGFWSFMAFRFLAGSGIGGEYSAINSAIDELVPARVRGRVALAINSSWWLGTALAAGLTVVLLNSFSANVGWRIGFGLGAILAVAVLAVRRRVPESPRWLLTHGRANEAEDVVHDIEEQVRKTHPDLPEPEGDELEIEQRESIGFIAIAKHVLEEYPGRGVLGFALMASQAVLYNATLFGATSILTTFFHASSSNAPLYLIPFAAGNLLGPWLLGPLFDSIGRKAMISTTYLASALVLFGTAWAFDAKLLSATTLTVCWSVCFFFASCGASAAYLTVSEIFPMETRAMAIALFYACGTGVAIAAPWTFGKLIQTGSYGKVTIAFVIGGVIMAIGGVVEIFLGVEAARRPLEAVAKPINAVRGRVGRRREAAATAR
ncbi:MAG: MFS transporter [Actinobacteria bacterium]|nr:MFS transporter [Actinomycetota bacterium]MBV8480624.1 MFS transporter [Actinomycetota bacterium]